MAINRTPIALGDANTVASKAWENEMKGAINDLKGGAVDSADGKVTASQVEIDSDATSAGDRSLIMRLTTSTTRVLKWLNSSGLFKLTDNGGSTRYKLELADGTADEHAVTKSQLDTAIFDLDTDLTSDIAASATKVAILQHQESTGTHGGDFLNNAWRTRPLNTIAADPNSIVTLANDEFTLGAGTYHITGKAPALGVDYHRLRLYNVTDAEEVSTSMNVRSSGSTDFDPAIVEAVTTITESKAFKLEHYSFGTNTVDGFGQALSLGGSNEVYANVVIRKIAK